VKPWLLKLHRWIALAFAAPLIVLIVTGLVLSVEPWLTTATIAPGALDAAKVKTLLARHDPRGTARAIVYRSYDGTLTVGAGRGGGTVVDVASGEARTASTMASLLGTARGLHERLLLDLGWLVAASTAAMLLLMVIGVLMGWPRFANTLAGWHKGVAWVLLPLLVLSPLTGLMLSFGITFAQPPATPAPIPAVQGAAAAAPPQAAPLTLPDALDIVAREHDLSTLLWLRPLGGRLAVRLAEGGEYRVYAVTRAGVTPMARNWPRLWHEGNFAGAFSAAMNLVISLALSLLLITGVWIWLRRTLKRRARRAERAAVAARA
jgi:uncharacterized iron-regulated membrane protein